MRRSGGGGRKFGSAYARRLRRKPPRSTNIWPLDEVVIRIAGKKHWLWRAVDQDGYVLDETVQTRDTKAAKRIITDKLASYGAARWQVMLKVEHRSHKRLNTRAENSHVPLQKRERVMQGFRSPGGLQRFTSVFSAVTNLFVPPHSHQSALTTHLHRLQTMVAWKAAAGVLT